MSMNDSTERGREGGREGERERAHHHKRRRLSERVNPNKRFCIQEEAASLRFQ
jgi:hypothetical protein